MTGDEQESISRSDLGEVPTAIGRVAIHAARVEHIAGVPAVTLIGTERAASVIMGGGWSTTKQALEVLSEERAGLQAIDMELIWWVTSL